MDCNLTLMLLVAPLKILILSESGFFVFTHTTPHFHNSITPNTFNYRFAFSKNKQSPSKLKITPSMPTKDFTSTINPFNSSKLHLPHA